MGAAGPGRRGLWLTDHGAACEEIGALGWLLAQVVRLADDGGCDEDRLRAELRGIADRARDQEVVVMVLSRRS